MESLKPIIPGCMAYVLPCAKTDYKQLLPVPGKTVDVIKRGEGPDNSIYLSGWWDVKAPEVGTVVIHESVLVRIDPDDHLIEEMKHEQKKENAGHRVAANLN